MDDVAKALVEDAITARLDLYADDQIGIPSAVENITFLGRSPLEYIDEGIKILTTTVSFNFDIKESI